MNKIFKKGFKNFLHYRNFKPQSIGLHADFSLTSYASLKG